MLKWITHMQISRRLFLAFLLAAVVPGIIISILGFSFINTQRIRSNAILTNIQAFKSASTTGTNLNRINELLNEVVHYQLEDHLPTILREKRNELVLSTSSIDSALQRYKDDYLLGTAPQMNEIYNILLLEDPNVPLANSLQQSFALVNQTYWPEYRNSQEQVLNAVKQNEPRTEIESKQRRANEKFHLLITTWNQIISLAEETNIAVAEVGPSQTGPILAAITVAFLITILVVISIAYIVHLTIVRPLHQLALLTKRISRGDTDARAVIIGEDEISLVAASMNNMLDNIVHLIQDAQSQRDALQARVEKMVGEVSGIGEGDLRVQAEVTADALGVLADSFNYMIEALGSLVVRVKRVTNEVDSSTHMIKQHMKALVNSGQTQLSQIADASKDIDKVTSASRQVADRSQELFSVAHTASKDAQNGLDAVRRVQDGMSRIQENVQNTAERVQNLSERSKEINDIVEVISGIAHQTNRLALDAAIQAAMAGENGKGFGAVAADIRRLAERAKDQVNLITRIVRGVRDDIHTADQAIRDAERETTISTRQTSEAGHALEAMFTAVEHQAREVEHMNQMATQQLHSIFAIAQAVRRICEVTHQNSSNIDEVSQSMERLGRLVNELRSSVEVFKLRENQRYFVPTTTMPLEADNYDTPLTVSGVFRSVSAISRPLKLAVSIPETGLPEVSEEKL